MKMKIILTVLGIFTFSILSAQCPGAEAENYKTKLQNAGSNMESGSAYAQLAMYYAYKCECDNGTNRKEQLIVMMNRIVDVMNHPNYSKYGIISKVYDCKDLSVSDSNKNPSSSLDTNNSENDIKKFLNEIGIENSDIENMLKGDFDTAIVNMRRNQDINAFTEVLGGNEELATGVYGLLGALADEHNKPKTPEQLKIIFEQKLALNSKVDYNTSKSKKITMVSEGDLRMVFYHNLQYSVNKPTIYKMEFYNLNRKLLSRTIHNSNKESITTDFISNKKTKTIYSDKREILTTVDLITGEVLVDNTKDTIEIIKNEKGEIIEMKTFSNNGQLYKDEFYDNKIFKTLAYKTITYVRETNKIKTISTHYKIKRKYYHKMIFYENGIPKTESIFSKGKLISNEEF
jgi:uncharacterized protein YjhX (UPF0386 family)